MEHIIYHVLPGPNEELRYSLRSLEKNGPPGGVELTFVGEPPEWVDRSRVNVIEGNPTDNRFKNALANYRAASEFELDDYWVFNDDFFILKPWPDPFPVWYWKPLSKHITESMRDPRSAARKQVFLDTYGYLRNEGIDAPNHYELHIPMKINGSEMLRILDETPGKPLLCRTLYGNLSTLPSEDHVQRGDVKHHSPYSIKEELDFLSTDENSFHRTLPLVKQFSKPSQWELS